MELYSNSKYLENNILKLGYKGHVNARKMKLHIHNLFMAMLVISWLKNVSDNV